ASLRRPHAQAEAGPVRSRVGADLRSDPGGPAFRPMRPSTGPTSRRIQAGRRWRRIVRTEEAAIPASFALQPFGMRIPITPDLRLFVDIEGSALVPDGPQLRE